MLHHNKLTKAECNASTKTKGRLIPKHRIGVPNSQHDGSGSLWKFWLPTIGSFWLGSGAKNSAEVLAFS